eukprot:PhM_4_TR1648/c0_g1_i1/m.52946
MYGAGGYGGYGSSYGGGAYGSGSYGSYGTSSMMMGSGMYGGGGMYGGANSMMLGGHNNPNNTANPHQAAPRVSMAAAAMGVLVHVVQVMHTVWQGSYEVMGMGFATYHAINAVRSVASGGNKGLLTAPTGSSSSLSPSSSSSSLLPRRVLLLAAVLGVCVLLEKFYQKHFGHPHDDNEYGTNYDDDEDDDLRRRHELGLGDDVDDQQRAENHTPSHNTNNNSPPENLAVVLFDFAARDAQELSAKAGDEVLLLHEDPRAGWAHAELHGGTERTQGWIPISYLRARHPKL